MPNPFDKFDKPQQQGFYPVGGVDPTRAPTIQRVTNEGAASVYDAPQKRETLRHTTLENDKLAREAKDRAAADAITSSTSTVHGPAYLNTIPANMRGVVAGVVQGRIPLPANALRTPYWQQVLAHATNMDPKFDAVNFNARSAARKDFTSGPDGASLTALETALLHEGQVKKAAEGLNNWSSPLINSVRDAYMYATGDGRLGDFQNKREAYVGEKQKVFVPTNGTEGDRIAARNQIPLNAAPDTFSKVFSGDATLYRSRLEALQAKYQRAMGTTADITDLLSPEAQRTYAELTGQKSGSIPFGGVYGEAGSGGGPGPGADGPPSVISGHPGGGGPGGFQRILNSYTGNANPGARSVVGGDEANRTAFDPGLSAELNTLIRARKTPEEINTYLRSRGADPVDAAGVLAAQAYLKSNPGYKASVGYATKSVPNTTWERISGSPLAAASVGATNAATAGTMDEIGGGVSALFGGNYAQTRDRIDAGKTVLAAAHPYANIAGNVAGGAASMLGGGELLDAAAGAGGLLGRTATAARGLNEIAPVIGDAAYGAAYGAGENNNDRLGGAGGGALAGGAGGMLGRNVTSGVGSAIAPTGGKLAPLYEQGVFPTLGPRLMASDNFLVKNLIGRPYNALEQAGQSLPGIGAAATRARQMPRDAYQIGGFNNALGDIGHALPEGMAPGTAPHAYAQRAFDDAYDSARSGMNFVHDPQFDAERAAWRDTLHNGVLSKDQAQQVKDVVNSAVGSRLTSTGGTALSGEAYKSAASDLSSAARAWGRSDPDKAAALDRYINIFDDAARRNSDPVAVNAMNAADRGYAKLVRIQRASELGGAAKEPGTYTPTTLLQASKGMSSSPRSAEFLRGDSLMQDYGTAGLPLMDNLPNSGTADRALATGAFGAAAFTHPFAAGAASVPLALTMPGVNAAVTRGMAPRSALGINPKLLAPIEALGTGIKDRAGMMGRVGSAGLLGYNLQP